MAAADLGKWRGLGNGRLDHREAWFGQLSRGRNVDLVMFSKGSNKHFNENHHDF